MPFELPGLEDLCCVLLVLLYNAHRCMRTLRCHLSLRNGRVMCTALLDGTLTQQKGRQRFDCQDDARCLTHLAHLQRLVDQQHLMGSRLWSRPRSIHSFLCIAILRAHPMSIAPAHHLVLLIGLHRWLGSEHAGCLLVDPLAAAVTLQITDGCSTP